MNLLALDYETFYSKEFSLSKMTTEEYLRDPQFEVIGVSVKVNDEPPRWASGNYEQIKAFLEQFDWANSCAVAHNAMFDMAILYWHFGIHPKIIFDTLAMARALHGIEVGGSLKNLAEFYQVGVKGTEVVNALGLHRRDFSPEQLSTYGDYCINDTELCYKIFHCMLPSFPRDELRLIDLTTRMFTEPALYLDRPLLETHLQEVRAHKEKLLSKVFANKEDLMSNPKFAQLLRDYGAEPPMKISPTTNKPAYAFAKTDDGLKELLEHGNPDIQALVSARLGVKSTLEETRTERFIGISGRGPLPVPLRYCGAHTKRWSGDEKLNMQNLTSRGAGAGKLKMSVMAPEGYVIVDCDSSQIEARTLAWLAGQADLCMQFANGEDVYRLMAAVIYGIPPDQVTKEQRFVGKVVILQAGYGAGHLKLQSFLKTAGVNIDLHESKRIINTYRASNYQIVGLWKQAQIMLLAMLRAEPFDTLGGHGVLKVHTHLCSIEGPTGLSLRYANLGFEQGAQGIEFFHKTRYGKARVYGGLVVENVVQHLARCIVAQQMLRIAKRYKVVLMVHDAVAALVPEAEKVEGRAWIEQQMRWVPPWATGLPLNCESGVGVRLGEC